MTRALTFSSAINAWTLQRGCAELGIELETTDRNPTLPLPVASNPAGADWLLFTEEASLKRALQGELSGRFLPQQFPLELLDDKWSFAAWLDTDRDGPRGLAQWSVDALDELKLPVILKAKHSWVGGRKLPRGWVCENRDDIRRRLRELDAQRLSKDWFFFQEWLNDGSIRLVSVCGFFDAKKPERNLTCVVERVADLHAGPSCSAAVVTRRDHWGLTVQTARILTRLDYVGPFELEFIVRPDQTLVLELNPRFWLQHGVFLCAGNGLLKRYFGLDAESDRLPRALDDVLWIDGFWLIRSAARLKWGALRALRPWLAEKSFRTAVFPPTLPALVGLMRWARRALQRGDRATIETW